MKYELHCHKCGRLVVRDHNRKKITCFVCKKKANIEHNRKITKKLTPKSPKPKKTYIRRIKDFNYIPKLPAFIHTKQGPKLSPKMIAKSLYHQFYPLSELRQYVDKDDLYDPKFRAFCQKNNLI